MALGEWVNIWKKIKFDPLLNSENLQIYQRAKFFKAMKI